MAITLPISSVLIRLYKRSHCCRASSTEQRLNRQELLSPTALLIRTHAGCQWPTSSNSEPGKSSRRMCPLTEQRQSVLPSVSTQLPSCHCHSSKPVQIHRKKNVRIERVKILPHFKERYKHLPSISIKYRRKGYTKIFKYMDTDTQILHLHKICIFKTLWAVSHLAENVCFRNMNNFLRFSSLSRRGRGKKHQPY